jgi:hypothetical protein
MSSAINAHAAKENWKQQFEKVSDEYFDQVYFHYQPDAGNAGRLSPVRRAVGGLLAQEHRRGDCRAEELREAHRGDSSRCSRGRFVPRSDREIVLANIRSQLLTLEDDSPVGEECGQLFEHLREWGVHADGAQVCFAG